MPQLVTKQYKILNDAKIKAKNYYGKSLYIKVLIACKVKYPSALVIELNEKKNEKKKLEAWYCAYYENGF